MEELIHGVPIGMFNKVCMTPTVFMRSCRRLKDGGLLDSTTNVSIEEQVLIFLTIMAQKQICTQHKTIGNIQVKH